MSRVRIEIDAGRIPCRGAIDWRRAASEGEDYELCFAASGDVPAAIADLPITPIGRVLAPGPEGPGVFMVDGSAIVRGEEMGWEHGGGRD
jgi:thiamine monophosphate kinase